MRVRTIALTVIACASCVSPVTDPGNGVYTPDVDTVVLAHARGNSPPPPGGTTCRATDTFTVTVASHGLAWSVCTGSATATGARALSDGEWTMLEAALDGLVRTEADQCLLDQEQIDLEVTISGHRRTYHDELNGCMRPDGQLTLDSLHAAEATMKALAVP